MDEAHKDEGCYVIVMVIGLLLAVVMCLATGCSSKAGWEFRVGVSPITHTSQTIQLNQKERSKYESRKY
jgi:hypothetical protein